MRYKDLLIRAVVFFLIVYGLIPWFFQYFSGGAPEVQTYRLSIFMFYTIILVAFFGVKYRSDLERLRTPMLRMEAFVFYGIAAVAFGSAFYLQYFTATFSPWLFALATFLYVGGAWCVSVAVFGLAFYREKVLALLFFTFLMYFFFAIYEILRQLWHFLAYTTAGGSAWLLHLFWDTAQVDFGNVQQNPVLSVEGFSVIIWPACSGIESLSLFIGLFVMLMVYEGDTFHKGKAAVIFILGLIGTYVMNIIRVSLIMVIGIYYPDFSVGVFHSQIGWILFSLFVLALLFLCYRWMKISTPEITRKVKVKTKIKK